MPLVPSKSVHRIAWRTGISRVLARAQRGMRVIMIHAVGDEDCPLAAFREQLIYLRRNYYVVPLDEIVGRLRSGAFRTDQIALTFDDGLRNTLEVAYPILLELGMPATVFVCPGLIDEGRWLWNHECRARLCSLAPAALSPLAAEVQAPAAQLEPIVEWMKTLPFLKRRQTEEAIRKATPGFRPTAEQKRSYDLLTWSELDLFDPAVMTIGAHTITHPILTTLSQDDLEHEIAGSRSRLEGRLRRPVRFFSYPNGVQDPRVVQASASCFEASVTTKAGLVLPGGNPHRIPRLSIADSVPHLAWRLYRHAA
jgi:peptidoglycan/xylan/chitin deacetylase (PgdA/CDA1 family)